MPVGSIQQNTALVTGLKIRLLGGFSVDYGDVPLAGVGAARLQSLLSYLLLKRGEPQQRQHLAFLFWPDTTDAQAQTNLRTLIYRLRRALPGAERFLEVNGHTLLWREDAPCWLDVASFETAVGENAPLTTLREAVALYRGDLLPGCYDEWIEPERERLRRRFAHAAERACHLLEMQRDYPAAIDIAQRLIHHDPLNEEGFRRLMRLHMLAGDRAGALRAYRTCEAALERELGVEPEPTTRELYQRLAKGGAPEATRLGRPEADSIAFIGREAEWEHLQRAWRGTLAGPSRLVLITGDAGIGKTRLSEEFAGWVERQGYATAWGRAYAMEGGLAYGPITPWVRTGLASAEPPGLDPLWLTEIARIVPELLVEYPGLAPPAPISNVGQRERFAKALVLGALARGKPTLLVLDDLQWCDSEALAWLHYLLRHDAGVPLMVLSTLRPDETDADPALNTLLTALQRGGQLHSVELGPLDQEESARLASEMGGGHHSGASPAIYAAAEGNPLFIVEAIRYHGTSVAAPKREAVPPTVRTVIAARLAQLSPTAHELARCAAVIGRHVSVDVLAAVSELDEICLARALDDLGRRRILVEGRDEQLDFTHQMVREVAYAEIGTTLRRHLHRATAEALKQFTPDPSQVSGEIAVHFERAGRVEPAVRSYLEAASVSHRMGATDEAMGTLRRARSLAEVGRLAAAEKRALTGEINEYLADLLYLTGRYAESRELCERTLLDAVEPVQRARLYRQIGKTYIGQRDYSAALGALGMAEDLLKDTQTENRDSQDEWMQVLLDRMSVLYWTDDWEAMEKIHRQIVPVLDRHGSPHQRRQHVQNIISMRFRRDRYVITEEMVSLARANVQSSIEEGHVPSLALARFRLAFTLLWYGAIAEASEEARLALELAQRTGDRSLELRCLVYLGVISRMLGDTPAVRMYAERSLAAATVMNQTEYAGMARANQAWVLWREGNDDGARSLAQSALEAWGVGSRAPSGFMFEWVARSLMMVLALRAGDMREAIGHARRMLHSSQQRLPDPINRPLEQAVLAWESGHTEATQAHLRQATEMAREQRYL